MDKRYQVFVSSTFEDLKEERQAALRAVLELDHMPAGMELFPAVDDAAWELIRDVIDASDYYVLIIGGRYGSLDELGIGYTEKEYDYATKTGKSVIALLHKNPNNLPRDRTDTDEKAWHRLSMFRQKVEKKHTCVFWESAEELKSRLIISLTATTKRRPATGWVRADQVSSTEAVAEILSLRNRIAELEAKLASSKAGPPPGSQDLAQGGDSFQIKVSFSERQHQFSHTDAHDQEYDGEVELTWNDLFAAIAPCMIDEATDARVRSRIEQFVDRRATLSFSAEAETRQSYVNDTTVPPSEVETCIVQLRALGLIQRSDRKRSLKDSTTYWTLTPYGDDLMIRLRALRKGETSLEGRDDLVEKDDSLDDAGGLTHALRLTAKKK